MNRRKFLGSAAAGIAGLGAEAVRAGSNPKPGRIFGFTKVFQNLDFAAMAERVVRTGLDGVEFPVRPGGHVEPERVEEDLPKAVEAFKAAGLELGLMTSGINAVDAGQHTEKVLKTAKALGVRRYRMAYYKYDLSKPIRPQLDELRPRLAELAALNKELGMQALYQNHSGKNYVGGPIWDICDLLEPHPNSEVALAFDIGHATVEGGQSWPIQTRLAEPHLGIVYVKDFAWVGRKREQRELGKGNVDFSFFKMLEEMGYQGDFSLHVEYIHRGEKDAEDRAEAAYKRDLGILNKELGWWASPVADREIIRGGKPIGAR